MKLININDIILLERTKRNLTQIDIANITKLSASSISRIEKGNRNASKTTLIKLALAFELDWDYFLKLKEKNRCR